MPQLSLYLNSDAMKKLRSDVERSGSSISKYVSGLIENRDTHSWPQGFWENVYGALEDPTFVVPSELDAKLDGATPSFDR